MFTYGFYNSIKGDRKYDAIQISSIFDGIIADGVYATVLAVPPKQNAFQVEACSPACYGVTVNTGRAWVKHTWMLNDSLFLLNDQQDDSWHKFQPPEVVYSRKDAVVFEVNSKTRTNDIKIITGTPSDDPQPPVLTRSESDATKHDDYIDQYAIAYVTIKPGATEIKNDDIDYRIGNTPTAPSYNEGIPFVTAVLETIDISAMVAQWKAQFQTWMQTNSTEFGEWRINEQVTFQKWKVSQEGQFIEWSTRERQMFDEWFKMIQIELDENVAALLLEKCRLLKTVRYVELKEADWHPVGDNEWSQTLTTDEHGFSLLYTEADNPILVSGCTYESGVTTRSSVKAYNKSFGMVSSGLHEINASDGSVVFHVFKRPLMDLRVGLKGV